MTKLVIILTLLIILLLLILYLFTYTKEGFQVDTLKPTTIKSYKDFLSFYNTFCSNWQKSIKSAVASQIPQQPLTNPSQVNSSTSPDIPEDDINNYIVKLSQEILKSLPSICKSFPQSLDSNSLPQIISEIPFINALNWMNSQLETAQANLGPALQGIAPTSETFEDMCDNIGACFDNNPELVKRVAIDLAKQQKEQSEQQEEQLVKALQPFLTEPELIQAFNKNKILFKQSQEIQSKAESGQLLNQVSIPDNNNKIKYTKPPGADNLIDMKRNNPAKYKEIEQNNKQLYSDKKLTDQINASL